MLLYFHRENEINKISSLVSFKLFGKLGVFRTQSNIYEGAFLEKLVNVNYFLKKASS